MFSPSVRRNVVGRPCDNYMLRQILRSRHVIRTRLKSSKAKETVVDEAALDVDTLKFNLQSVEEALKQKLQTCQQRSRRIDPAVFDALRIPVNSATSAVLFRDVAQVTIRDSKTITVTVFDESHLKPVTRALQTSSLGFNNPQPSPKAPQTQLILYLPPITRESRLEQVKAATSATAHATDAIRDNRRIFLTSLKKQSAQGGILMDSVRRVEAEVERVVKAANGSVAKLFDSARNSIMT